MRSAIDHHIGQSSRCQRGVRDSDHASRSIWQWDCHNCLRFHNSNISDNGTTNDNNDGTTNNADIHIRGGSPISRFSTIGAADLDAASNATMADPDDASTTSSSSSRNAADAAVFHAASFSRCWWAPRWFPIYTATRLLPRLSADTSALHEPSAWLHGAAATDWQQRRRRFSAISFRVRSGFAFADQDDRRHFWFNF